MSDVKKHVAQQMFENLFEEYSETAWNIKDEMEPNTTVKSNIPSNDRITFRVVRGEDIKLRYERLSCVRVKCPPPGYKKSQFVQPNLSFPTLQPCDEQRRRFLLKDQFHKEIQRGIYKKNPNDPTQDSLAYHKAAENYALFGSTPENPNTGFEVFKSTGANCNQTYYPNNMTVAWQQHTKPYVGQVPAPSLLEIKIINSSKSYMTHNKRVQIKALKNFCKEAVVVNSVLSAAYKQHMNFLLSLNYQPHLQHLARVAATDPRVFTYGHRIAEYYSLANRAYVMAQILQKKPVSSRSIVRVPTQIAGQVNYQQHIEILKISHCGKICYRE